MAVHIDEITAEIEPPRTEPALTTRARPAENQLEVELRNQRDLLIHLETRAARVRAD